MCRRTEAKKTRKRRWQAYIFVLGVLVHLGYSVDEADAARLYDAEARKHNMPTNF